MGMPPTVYKIDNLGGLEWSGVEERCEQIMRIGYWEFGKGWTYPTKEESLSKAIIDDVCRKIVRRR